MSIPRMPAASSWTGEAQYRSVIFSPTNRNGWRRKNPKKALAESGGFDKPIVTEILPLGPFYEAEEYHQDYYKKNPIRCLTVSSSSGRNQFLEKVWGS